ncbi:hypothetical protein [Diplocloster hominis]|uniref:hypothetical protein n=1 Tax=Diplocloster hominis TaxID=3079010 RepID=UPI0031B9F1ED
MRIIVRSRDVNLWLPVPLRMAGAAVSLIPESVFLQMQKSVPAPYGEFVTKQILRDLVRECISVLLDYRGLEIVHIEASDGTFVSIKL